MFLSEITNFIFCDLQIFAKMRLMCCVSGFSIFGRIRNFIVKEARHHNPHRCTELIR